MAEAALFSSIELPYCQALMFERWDAAPGRYFVAWRARDAFAALLGGGVVDEFRTISGPLLLAPSSALGSIYDAGMRLADARDLDLPIDQGWPPLTIGIDVAAPERLDDWIAQFLGAVQKQKSFGKPPWQHATRTVTAGQYQLQNLRCSVRGRTAASILVTDAPLLPQQLQRLAETGSAPITIAVATGNRLPRVTNDQLQQVDVVSEQTLALLVASAGRLEAGQK